MIKTQLDQTQPENKFNMQISVLDNTGQPNKEFLKAVLADFKKSPRRELMLTAQDYYQNINDISERKRTYIDELGVEQEAKLLTNNKLSHPFLRKLVNQKINYLLSKIFTVSSTDDAFAELLNERFNKNFHRLIKNVGKDAVINGIGWLQAYYDPAGELKYKRIPPEEIKPFWADADHTVLSALLRVYVLLNYDIDGTSKEIMKVEYYTNEGVWYYTETDGELLQDAARGTGIQPNYTLEEIEPETNEVIIKPMVWGKIPFIPFKYNFDEIPLLQFIKSLVDNYDYITSDTGNHIQDIPNAVKVIKNYDGNPDQRAEFSKNVATYGTIYVRGDGGVETLETPFDIATVDGHLDRLRKDTYDFANGVDMQEVNVGNKSGEALKFKFADLDMDTEDFANELQLSFQNAVWFIKEDVLIKREGDFTGSDFEIIFNKDIAINELEAMDICLKAQSISGISQKTIVGNVPFVTDAEAEISQWEEEQTDGLDGVRMQREFARVQNGEGERNE